MRKLTFKQAISEAYEEELERDERVFVIGEDIQKAWGGPLGDLQNLPDKFWANKQIRPAPISETAILGGAIGAAATGMRPVAFMHFCNFLGVCGDELLNQLSAMRYMYGGKAKLPLTIVAYSGGGVSAAAQHSKCLEGFIMTIPGIKVVAPSTPYDAKGLLKAAIRDDNPVMYFERTLLMLKGIQGEVPEEEYIVPLGKADIKRKGTDVTVVAIGTMVHRALKAADDLQKQGISLEVIDARSLVPLDKTAILDSVAKTGRLAIIDEEPKTGSAACTIASMVAEEGFNLLKKPIKLVCAPDTPVPFSAVMEKFWMPDEDNLIQAVTEIM